jgi:hypothetical protein
MAQLRIEAKPTTYAGIEMRSRLEAGWAASLDQLGIEWEYEPETIRLESGAWYVPDFWLPALRTVIEVKGMGVPGIRKPIELSRELPGVIVIIGFEPVSRYVADWLWRPFLQWRDAAGYDARLAQCPECSAWQWMRAQITRRCRLCKALHEGTLATSGEMKFTNPEADHHAFLDAFTANR